MAIRKGIENKIVKFAIIRTYGVRALIKLCTVLVASLKNDVVEIKKIQERATDDREAGTTSLWGTITVFGVF